MLQRAAPGATFLLNAPYGPDEIWDHLPREVQQQIIDKKLKFYVIDAYDVAWETGMGGRINTIMQTCFFAHLRRAAARRGHRRDQVRDQEDLRQEGRGGRAEELRGRGQHPGPPARGGGARRRSTSDFDACRPTVPGDAPGFRAARSRRR
ncbi:MAG: hypothetical protein U5J83_07985 [Bryobacterales bacterium]|nr:hypothetical protein [Bryobacterales bacterium]